MEKEDLEDSTARRRLEVLRILLDKGNVDIDLSEPTEEELYRVYRKVTWSIYQGKDLKNG